MKIVVLAGGISTERDVSLVSGTDIYRALKQKGHNVVLLDVYLGYDGDPARIFEQDTDWAVNMAHIATSAPDIDAVKACINEHHAEYHDIVSLPCQIDPRRNRFG